MKKYLLVFAATGLLFASCGSTTEDTIDSNLTEVELEAEELQNELELEAEELREQAALEAEELKDQIDEIKDAAEEKIEAAEDLIN